MEYEKKLQFWRAPAPTTVFALAALITVLVVAAPLLDALPAYPVDWRIIETRALRHLDQPYARGWAFNPPWTFALLAVFLPLPYSAGAVRLVTVVVLFSLASSEWQKRREGGRLPILSLLLLLTSAPAIYLIINANIDFLPALGLLAAAHLSPAWALPLLLTKPHTGALAAVAWLRKAWDTGRWRGVVRFAAPTVLVLVLSFVVWGWWPGDLWRSMHENHLVGSWWNVSLFPWGIPLGLYLLWRTWRNEDELAGLAATLALSPYFAMYSLATLLALWIPRQRNIWLVVAAWALSWLLWFGHIMFLLNVG
jgi:hypothetical protein